MSGVDIAGLVSEWRKAMEGVTPGPWKSVCQPNFGNGYTYTSVQPVEPDRERLRHLAMASGEFHVCRMTHTPLERKFRLYERDAAWIARCSPSGISALLDALSETTRQRDEALAALKASGEREEGLLASLIWMVANDETNEGDTPMPEYGGRSWDEINAYWIDGLNRAREAIAKSQSALGSRPNLADATNNPPSDPGTEQREAGV